MRTQKPVHSEPAHTRSPTPLSQLLMRYSSLAPTPLEQREFRFQFRSRTPWPLGPLGPLSKDILAWQCTCRDQCLYAAATGTRVHDESGKLAGPQAKDLGALGETMPNDVAKGNIYDHHMGNLCIAAAEVRTVLTFPHRTRLRLRISELYSFD